VSTTSTGAPLDIPGEFLLVHVEVLAGFVTEMLTPPRALHQAAFP
jgi:hypothetical protein